MEAQGVVATAFGGPEVLQFRSIDARRQGGEVRIRQTAIGVNYIDVYIRKGLYRMIEPPAPIGMEAAGVVRREQLAGVQARRPRRVCRAAAGRVRDDAHDAGGSELVLLPDHVSDETAAAVMLKGMTAEYLLHRTHPRAARATRCWCTPRRAASACCSASGRRRSARR